MKQEKAIARLFSGKKAFTLMLAVLLVLGCSVGATLAYLTATTNEVKNTFTVGKVAIDLNEHEYDPATNALKTGANDKLVKENDDYKLIPGRNMPKDPFVTVAADSEKCWLFVRIDEANNSISIGDLQAEDVVAYSPSGDWKALNLGDRTYTTNGIRFVYRIVDTADMDKSLYVLEPEDTCTDITNHANGCVTVHPSVDSSTTAPVLKFTAAAIQYDGLEVVDGGVTGTDYTTQAAKAAFNNLPDAFKSTTNLNNTTVTEPETPVGSGE